MIFITGNAKFFEVEVDKDPIGLLPKKVILGINKCGIHLFRPVPYEYLRRVEFFQDVLQFSSEENKLLVYTKIAGVHDTFQFKTVSGKEICTVVECYHRALVSQYASMAEALLEQEPTDDDYLQSIHVSDRSTEVAKSNQGMEQKVIESSEVYEEHLIVLSLLLRTCGVRVDQSGIEPNVT